MSYMLKSQREYGPVTRHWLGPKLQIFISDPNDVEVSFCIFFNKHCFVVFLNFLYRLF